MNNSYFIDSHAHLYREYYPDDFQEVIARAIEHRVEKVILPCVSAESIPDIFEAVKQFPNHLFPLIGLHPTDVNQDFKYQLSVLENHLDVFFELFLFFVGHVQSIFVFKDNFA